MLCAVGRRRGRVLGNDAARRRQKTLGVCLLPRLPGTSLLPPGEVGLAERGKVMRAGFDLFLEAGARECFLLDVSKEAAVSGNFELISEGVTPEPLGVVVSGAAGADPLYETHGQPDGTFAFDVADDGVVDLCLSNGDASNNDGRARTVGFAIRASVHHPSTDGEGSMDALLDVSEELNEGLLTLTDHQAYMRRREEHHAAVLESTRARVLWWTVAETAVLIALSLWQILTVRAFFETKRRL